MGVMACDREGCQNIMCERLILRGRFYICSDCWGELCEYKQRLLGANTAPEDLETKIKDFMYTCKKDTIPSVSTYLEFENAWEFLTNNGKKLGEDE